MRAEEPVSRIMTEAVVVIEADRPVSEALDCFMQYSFHHLPVVRQGRLIGMLSSADVLKLESFLPRNAQDRTRLLDDQFRIEQIMRTPVTARRAAISVGEAAELIIAEGVHALPIVDDEGHVIGIVSTTDIVRSFLRGPPRRHEGTSVPVTTAREVEGAEPTYHRKPSRSEHVTALQVAELLHVEARDPKYLGKTLLYLDQRCSLLEKVLEQADRYLMAGQDEHNHALLLKAILAAKRAEEHATGAARVPFPLQ